MQLLIIGLVLWWGLHVLQRLAPGMRGGLNAALGEKAVKGGISIALLVSVVLMVIGFQGAETVQVYHPLPGIGYLSDLLMLPAIFLLGAGAVKGRVVAMIRHPMLTGALIWAVAHLLVTGDQAAIVLFGGIGAWAIVQMMLINWRVGAWDRPAKGPVAKDKRLAVMTLVLYVVFAGLHYLSGLNPFIGTYQ